MKLRTKVQLFLSGFMALVILVINSAVYVLYEERVSENELNRVKADAENVMEAIAENSTVDLDNENLLKAFLPANAIIRIIEEDMEEALLHEVYTEEQFTHWPFSYLTSEQTRIARDESKTPYAQVSIPIIWEDGSIVTLQVSEALYSMEDSLSTLQLVLFLTAGLMLIPALFAGYFLSRYITKQIQSLTLEMKENPKKGKWEKLTINKKNKDEISEMQQAYNAMIERIEENRQKQERFVSDASHELRTPISVIRSYAELLKRRGKDKPEIFDEATDAILSESDRMQHLTEQMLILAKNEDQENIIFEQVNISQIARDVIRSLSTAYQREIKYYHDVDHDITIGADRRKIQQAIYILVDNACKYSEDIVLVRMQKNHQQLTIDVSDKGEGLTENELVHIFDRFYRVDKARSRKAGGTGLGLAICHQIIQAHGGEIEITSQVNQGSTFTLKLPM
ncbi:HAMP domain-containing protein [Gracilibacillus salitolerans]|uniref:histidine kinase n=1 Tax=Gracilibacillus salitolerans TaxID=2663022 RepID=A0A5Q2TNW9_9BACI|nr:HAMP domain-containing sensor histidine kinase [Gracilibacillus salitolerans]QGH35831.1 HAMP domain-containing protein [Gracilibacillus salitolerans]